MTPSPARRRTRVLAVVSTGVLAVVSAATALGAPAVRDPSRLILTKADFPGGAAYTWGRMPASFTRGLAATGITGRGAYFTARVGASATKHTAISGTVVTTATAAQGRRAYQLLARDLDRSGTSRVGMRPFGDAQLALFTSPRVGSKMQLLVRKARVVWQVEVAGGGLLVIPRARLLAETAKYAAKLERRVGAG